MLVTLVIAFTLSLTVGWLVMPKAGRFIFSELRTFCRADSHTGTLMTTIILLTGGLGLASFLLYKICLSIWAYGLSGDVIEHFVLSRGVFLMEEGTQFAFRPQSLGMLMGTVILKFFACSFIYNRTGYFLQILALRFQSARGFDLGTQILLSFGAVLVFLGLEVMFLAQNIASVSKYSNLALLTLGNLSLIVFFVSIIHLRYKRDHPEYFVDLQTYVNVDRPLLRVLRSHGFSVAATLLFGFGLHLPQYLGIPFLRDNVLLILLMLGISVTFISVVFRRFFVKLFDVLTRVFLLPHFGSEPISTGNRWWPGKWALSILTSVLGGVILWRAPSLFSLLIFLIFIGGMVLLMVIGSLSGILRLVLSLVKETGIKHSSSGGGWRESIDHYFAGARWSLLLVEHTLRPGLIPLLLLGILLVGWPKKYEIPTERYSQTVFDRDSVILYQNPTPDGFRSVPIRLSAVPEHLRSALLMQEDRGLMKQRSWLPNHHNWFGISASSLVRFITREGGGSNITNQLCKNEAFHGRRVQDVQRKFFELIASFQMALSMSPDEQLERYLNRVSMYGGKGHRGLYMAALAAFGKPPAQLNELQSLLLVRSLQYGVRFPLIGGQRVPYDSVRFYPQETTAALLARYRFWQGEGLIDEKTVMNAERQTLFAKQGPPGITLATSTREFLRKQLPGRPVSLTSLTWSNQQRVKEAMRQFESRMGSALRKGPYRLQSAALAVDCRSGEVVAHHGGNGISDLADFGAGFQMGSVMKPFILMELLAEKGGSGELRLFDGSRDGRETVQNFSRRYSNRYVDVEEILSKSLNAPFHNISEITPAIEVFQSAERRFQEIGITSDASIDLVDPLRYQSNLQNYPLGLRRMTLMDVARAYQVLFNEGMATPISLFADSPKHSLKVYDARVCDQVKRALAYTLMPGGTGTHFAHLLPGSNRLYAKTGTSDEAIHGWTVLSDGRLLIVSFVTYGTVINDRLELNRTPAIPTGSGAQTAGVLAALLYHHLTDVPNGESPRGLLALSD